MILLQILSNLESKGEGSSVRHDANIARGKGKLWSPRDAIKRRENFPWKITQESSLTTASSTITNKDTEMIFSHNETTSSTSTSMCMKLTVIVFSFFGLLTRNCRKTFCATESSTLISQYNVFRFIVGYYEKEVNATLDHPFRGFPRECYSVYLELHVSHTWQSHSNKKANNSFEYASLLKKSKNLPIF